MNPAWGHVVGIVIVLLMLIFIGIWIWAWLPHHKRKFDRMSRIPMEDPSQRDGRAGKSPQDVAEEDSR